MLNIEKEFYDLIEKQFGDKKSIAFHFAQYGVLEIRQMEKYLIIKDFERITTEQPRRKKISIYEELGEKYFKSNHAIKKIIDRI